MWVVLSLFMRATLSPFTPLQTFEKQVIIPQYSPYLPYSIGLNLGGSSPSSFRLFVSIISIRPTLISLPYNITIGNRIKSYLNITFESNRSVQLFESNHNPGGKLLITFGPGLFPTDNLHSAIEVGDHGSNDVPDPIWCSLFSALLFQTILYALHIRPADVNHQNRLTRMTPQSFQWEK